MRKLFLLSITATLIIFSSCKKDPENYEMASLSDYYPTIVGKYVVYKLDSLTYVNFGAKDTTISYQVKHYVDALITDNLGRPAYRIIRSIRKLPTDPWMPDNTFMAVVTDNAVEFTENNLRYIKLKRPIRDGFSWRGNSYIDTKSLNSDFKYLDEWDYTYDSVNVKTTVGAYTLDSTLKVVQKEDEILGNPSDPNAFSERNYSWEKYAKGIGLVYRKFLHSEYQPPTTPGANGKYALGSYGITMTMIDHN